MHVVCWNHDKYYLFIFFTFLSLDISLSCRLRCYNAIRVLTETPFNFFYVYVPRHMIYDFNDIIVEISDLFWLYLSISGRRKKTSINFQS